uniref:XPG N-terminal domain-containing protein n=1 Tax=Anopheles farauti TaxID=69004 RepID=A0A182Q224_9DIPT
MGVHGLTNFIATNASLYLKPHELHDTKLVIDGDNLCVQLFKKSQHRSPSFGGSYDVYYRIVDDFFELLKLANVVPYVLLDGGYEKRKMGIVQKRLNQKIRQMRGFSVGAISLSMPPMMREVFVDALQASGVKYMRCPFEADDEIAVLARKLNCPVLSYDSDFYIHDVQYIPYVTLSHKVFHKVSDKEGENFKVGVIKRTQLTKVHRRPNSVRFIAQCGDDEVEENGDGVEQYSYIDCCLYTIDNLIGPYERLGRDMIPLFAVLLGNDYIQKGVLKAFNAKMKAKDGKRSKGNRNERRLKLILKWLQGYTLHSATRAIIRHIPPEHKQQVYRKILTAMRGYNCEECTALNYFGFEEHRETEEPGEEEDIEKDLEERLGDAGIYEEEQADADETVDLDNDEESASDEEEEEEEEVEEGVEEAKTESNDENPSDCEENSESEPEIMDGLEPVIGPGLIRNKYTDRNWPDWFKDLYRGAKVPRFLADLLHSNLCINYPQIEDYRRPDANTVSYPILHTIFAILKTSFKVNTTEFKYLTRRPKGTRVQRIEFQNVYLPPGIKFKPCTIQPDESILMNLYEQCGIARWRDLFAAIKSAPSNWRLYLLAIVYWAKNCTNATVAHVHAVLLGMLQLQIVDKALKTFNRSAELFRRQSQAFLEQQRKALNASKEKKPAKAASFTRAFFNQLTSGTSRTEALLAYEWLIVHFALREKSFANQKLIIDPATLHTLAEFQSVCCNLYALNPLLGYPYENLRMNELLNFMFVYNVHETIKARADLVEYAETMIFQHSPTLLAALRVLVAFVEEYVPELKDRQRVVRTRTRVSKHGKNGGKKRRSKGKKGASTNGDGEKQNGDGGKANETSESEDEAFIDINNAFSQLLLAKKK